MARQSEQQLNQFNQQLRANPEYQAFLRSIGVNTNVAAGQAWRLSDQQRKQAEDWVRRRVGDIGDLEIDISGNANQNEGFGKQAKRWAPIVGGTVAALFGVPGLFPGLIGGGGGGAAAAGGAQAAGAAGGAGLTEGLMSAVPASIASQGASAAIPIAAGAGAAGAVGAIPSASIPGLETAIPASITSQGVSQTLGTAMPRGGGDGGGLPSFLKDLATPENAASLAALIAGLSSNNSGSAQNTEEMRRIQAITEAQMRRADPLHQVATNLAFGRLPVNYRQGVQMNNIPLPEYPNG